MNVTPLRDADLAWADCVFISAMMVQRDVCRRGDRPVQGGGAAGRRRRAALHRRMGELPRGRSLVLNEAEITLPPFLADFAAGRAQRIYTTDQFADMHATPIPRWDLANLKQYATLAIQFSRGCPFDCEFCNITALYGHRPRVKTAAQIVAELDLFYRLGWRGPCLLRGRQPDRQPALSQGRTAARHHRMAQGQDRDAVQHGSLDQPGRRPGADAPDGRRRVSTASSSASRRRRRTAWPSATRSRTWAAIWWRTSSASSARGCEVQGGFILGFDSDTPSTFQRQIDFIQRSGIVTAMVGLLQAPPATRLWQRMAAEGRLLGAMSGNNVAACTNILPKMPLETLVRGLQGRCRATCMRRSTTTRALITFLREVKPPKFTAPDRRANVKALFRSVGRLGIVGQGARPVLEAVLLDAVPQAPALSPWPSPSVESTDTTSGGWSRCSRWLRASDRLAESEVREAASTWRTDRVHASPR